MKKPCVYRHFDADQRVLYIGATGDHRERTRQHKRRSPWFAKVIFVRAQPYATIEEARAAEKRAIAEERPPFNISDSSGRPRRYGDIMFARFLDGTFDRIAVVLDPSEDRADFMRRAVEKELERREKRESKNKARKK